MDSINLNELYFKWLCSIAFPDENIRNKYLNVLNLLNDTSFEYILQLDENRQKDGVDMRYHFSCACKIPYDIIKTYFNNPRCSVLEMMISLAKRCEDFIMSDLSYGDRTDQWFLIMFNNLELYKYDDEHWNVYCYYEVKNILRKFMFREYDSNGSNGGIFISNNPNYDLRNMQLWDQMGLCMQELILSKQ